jgi:hypothetical protein
MPLVISKNQIDSIERNKQHLKKVDELKESKSINREVNPPKAPKMIKISKPPSQPKPKLPPKHIMEMIQKQREEREYTEYKECINNVLTSVLSKAEPNENYNQSLQQKISNSKDLKKIIKNKVIDYTHVENEFIVFLLTLGGYYLENRIV